MHVNAISFGGGVQSWALAVLTATGKIDNPPTIAIMADTGDENPETFRFIDRHRDWLTARGLELVVVRRDDRPDLFAFDRTVQNGTVLPVRLMDLRSEKPRKAGIANRTCTKDWKIVPFRRYLRSLGAKTATACLGISLDEAHRMKPSGRKWIANRFPLIELRWRREDCERLLINTFGEVPPKSSCLGCPFQKLERWRWLQQNYPERFNQAVQDEKRITKAVGVRQFAAYMTPAYKPLDELAADWADTENGEDAECEGVCFL